MKVRNRITTTFMIAAMVAHLSCAGREEASLQPQSPSMVPAPAASGTISSTSFDPTPGSTTPWIPPGTFSCPLGKGDPGSTCHRTGGAPVFLEQVDAAINELVEKRPELFDRSRVIGENGYLVLDSEKFYLGVAEILQTKGLCAGWDLKELQVKNSNGFSEQYELVLSNGHIWRGAGSFRSTCSPANFPLDAADRIDDIRVAFYAIECEDGRTPPRNSEAQLPVECTGYVTATPKDKDNKDVDKRVHGPYITWELEQPDDYVFMEDFEGVDFNKFLRGLDPGRFNLCATVQTKRNCLHGLVTEKQAP